MALEHELAYLTARIEVETQNNNSIGTGFFFGVQIMQNDVKGHKLMLISNKHVFLGSEGTSESQRKLIIHLNRSKEDNMPDLGNKLLFKVDNFEHRYYPHPDPNIDLACFDITDVLGTNVFYKYLDESYLRPINYQKIALGSDVIFVGYPENIHDTVNNLPLVRKGSIASMPDVDFNGKGQIVIDAQVFPGSSGSPVFVMWDNTYSLLGVVFQTMIRNSQLQILPANIPLVGVEQILGLGIVVKQKHVLELIDYTVSMVRQNISAMA